MTASPDLSSLDLTLRELLHLLALGGDAHTRSWLYDHLPRLRALQAPGPDRHRRATHEQLRERLGLLEQGGWIVEASQAKSGYWRVAPPHWAAVYGELLQDYPVDGLRGVIEVDALAAALQAGSRQGRVIAPGRTPLSLGMALMYLSESEMIAWLRLEAYAGADVARLDALRDSLSMRHSWEHLWGQALFDVVETSLFNRLHPDVQAQVLLLDLAHLGQYASASTALGTTQVLALARQWLQAADAWTHAAAHEPGVAGLAPFDPADLKPGRLSFMRQMLAEALALTGPSAALQAQLPALRAGGAMPALLADLLMACEHLAEGDWAALQAGFERALPELRKLTQQRKGLLQPLLATSYVQALLAQGGAARLQTALKFCLTESGKRTAEPDNPWGVMALAIQMRLGEQPRELTRLRPLSRPPHLYLLDYWVWLMRAWLAERGDAHQAALRLSPADEAAYALLHSRLRGEGLLRPLAQLEAAHAVLHQQAPALPFFVAASQ
jgi:hypothetical protein